MADAVVNLRVVIAAGVFLILLFFGERLWRRESQLPARALVLVAVQIGWLLASLLVSRRVGLLFGQVAVAWIAALLVWGVVRLALSALSKRSARGARSTG
jgi:hypothetical protein